MIRKGLSKAVSAIDDGDYSTADQLLSEILSKDAEAVEALIHRAYARLRHKRLSEARADAERACQLRPENGVFHMILGEVLLAMNEGEAAYQALRKAVAMERDNGRALFHLGQACLVTQRSAEAGDYFESALQFERDYVLAQWMAKSL